MSMNIFGLCCLLSWLMRRVLSLQSLASQNEDIHIYIVLSLLDDTLAPTLALWGLWPDAGYCSPTVLLCALWRSLSDLNVYLSILYFQKTSGTVREHGPNFVTLVFYPITGIINWRFFQILFLNHLYFGNRETVWSRVVTSRHELWRHITYWDECLKKRSSMSHVFCSQIAMLLQNKRLLLVIIGEHSSRSRVVSQVRFTSNSWLSICALIHRD